MRRLSAIHLTVAATLSVLSAMSIAGLAQPVDSQQPAGSQQPVKPSDENDPPPGGCNPIGLTASGEIVFPMTCRDFIERHRASDHNSSATEVKPTTSDDKANAKETKPNTAQASTKEEQRSIANQAEGPRMEISKSVAEPATTASVQKRAKARNRTAGPPGCTKFQTYEASSGTYKAYNGRRRPCRQGEAVLVVE
jgi:hypothetical protein